MGGSAGHFFKGPRLGVWDPPGFLLGLLLLPPTPSLWYHFPPGPHRLTPSFPPAAPSIPPPWLGSPCPTSMLQMPVLPVPEALASRCEHDPPGPNEMSGALVGVVEQVQMPETATALWHPGGRLSTGRPCLGLALDLGPNPSHSAATEAHWRLLLIPGPIPVSFRGG